MHARLDRAAVKLLTRTGVDWTQKYPAIAKAVTALDVRQRYLDGELSGVGPDGITSFNIVQLASDSGNAAALVFFLFDLLYFDCADFRQRPLVERKNRLSTLLADTAPSLHYSDHIILWGRARPFTRRPVRYRSRASSPNASKRPTRPAIAGYGPTGVWRRRQSWARLIEVPRPHPFCLEGWVRSERGGIAGQDWQCDCTSI
jgi:hypothetical protein